VKFQLYLNPLTYHLQIISEGQRIQSAESVLLAERDPDQEMIFSSDCAFYNPLLKRYDALQLFLVNGEQALIGYHSGKAPIAFSSKAERAQISRGWFKIAPRNLNASDVPVDVYQQLESIPRMKGVLSQALRSRMGLRVPEELEARDFAAWIAWISAQRLAVTPTIRRCFEALKMHPEFLIFPEATKIFLSTGVEPEPLFDVRMRYCEIKTTKQILKQLFESYEHQMKVPRSLVEAGDVTELLARAVERFGENLDQLETYPTGLDTIDSNEEPLIEKGWVILARGPDDQQYRLLSSLSNPPDSIHDLFAKVIEEQEQNATTTTRR
jgi:hypothetical protein